MLQRIYGTAWADKKALSAYLQRLEEAVNATTVKSVSSLTCIIWEEARVWCSGTMMAGAIFRELEVFVRSKLKEYQYQEVKGPFMMDRVLWGKNRSLG